MKNEKSLQELGEDMVRHLERAKFWFRLSIIFGCIAVVCWSVRWLVQ